MHDHTSVKACCLPYTALSYLLRDHPLQITTLHVYFDLVTLLSLKIRMLDARIMTILKIANLLVETCDAA